jgi:Xaa-Pro aminopeptidase
MSDTTTLLSGVPSINKAVFHAIRFDAHDPASLIVTPDGKRTLVLRDVEVARARKLARADEVFCYEDFEIPEGLSGDREVRAAQATAVCLKRMGVEKVVVDRSLPMVVFDACMRIGIGVSMDLDLGVKERRSKDEQEVAAMREATRVTESAIRMACETIGAAEVNAQGELLDPESSVTPLTAERVKAMITGHLAERGCFGEHHIVAGGPEGGDCHNTGHGRAADGRAGDRRRLPQAPRDGLPRRLHAHGRARRGARRGAQDARDRRRGEGGRASRRSKAGVTGEDVHKAVIAVIQAHGLRDGLPARGGSGDGVLLDAARDGARAGAGPQGAARCSTSRAPSWSRATR